MPKIRVYKIAEELNISTKAVIEKLAQFGVTVTNHASTIEQKDATLVYDHYAPKKDAKATQTPQNAAQTTPSAQPYNAANQQRHQESTNNNTQTPQSGATNNASTPQNAAQTTPSAQPYNAANQQRASNYQGNNNRSASGTGQVSSNYKGNRPNYQGGTSQNSGQTGSTNQQRPSNYQGNNNSTGATGQVSSNYKGNRPNYQGGTNQSGGQTGSTNQQRPSNYQGTNNRSTSGATGQVSSNYKGNRPNNQGAVTSSTTAFSASRASASSTSGYNSNRSNTGANNASRTNSTGGYNANRTSYSSDSGTNSGGAQTRTPNTAGYTQTRTAGGQNYKQNTPFNAAQKKEQRKKSQATAKTLAKARQEAKDADALKKAEEAAEALEWQAIEDEIKTVALTKSVVVKELAEKIKQPIAEVIKKLMKVGIMANVNQEIDYYTAAKIAEGFEYTVTKAEEEDILQLAFAEDENDTEGNVERSPVVVVMGHVDHGKTSLLDHIRKSKVASGEAGGITQHIGAYTVSLNDKLITFLDTPGHEAFTAMRMRGARVTDIAILVVAADDGVMPQTIEAINHAKAAGVEIIIAINKMDKPSANPDRVKQELAEHGLLSEEWGGETIVVPVSALTGEGVDQLLEMITLVAEIKELTANPNKKARGAVIEALLDKGRGPVATILVQNGTLNVGDPIVAGTAYGKIRAMIDAKGRKVKSAGPSTPVEVLGLSEVPLAGDSFYVAASEKQARLYAESVIAQGRVELMKDTPTKVSLDDLFSQIKSGNIKDLNIVVKADVQGSVEAVKNSLERLSNEEVRIRTIHGGVGAITETDVMLASASNAIIIGFNVRPEPSARAVADVQKVDIRLYRIIYSAIEDITAAMKGMLDPVYEEKIIGHAEIRLIFKATNIGTVGGSYVTDGKIMRNCKVRVTRDEVVVYEGGLDALKRFKDDAKEVAAGYECGISFVKFNDIKEGDLVEAYVMEEVKR